METNLLCEIHNSPIGGVCSDTNCFDYPSIMCIKCVVDPNSCIRKKNHKLIALKEIFNDFFHNKSIHEFKQMLHLYLHATKVDTPKLTQTIKTLIEEENKNHILFKHLLVQRLSGLFIKEKEKLQSVIGIKNTELKQSKDILNEIQTEFNIYLQTKDDVSSNNFSFSSFCDEILKSHNENNITTEEAYIKTNSYITNLKHLLINCNTEKTHQALDNINSFVNFSNKSNNSIKTEMENKIKIISRNIIEEINYYLGQKDAKTAGFITQNSNRSSLKSGTSSFSKTLSIQSKTSRDSLLKTLSSKSKKPRKFKITKTSEMLCKDIQLFSPYVQDKHIIILDTYGLLVYSKPSSFIVYNYIIKQEKLNIELDKNEIFYEKKHMNDSNGRDVIISASSIGRVLIIILENNEITYNSYSLTNNILSTPTSFDVVFELETFFNTEKDSVYFYFSPLDSPMQSWYISNPTTLSMVHIFAEDTKTKQIITKLEVVDDTFTTGSDMDLGSKKRYVLRSSNLGLEIYSTKTQLLYHCFNPKKKICNSFMTEKYNKDLLIYSIWEDGALYIFSFNKKILIKEVAFNLKKIPIYSIAYVNDNNVIIGGEKIMFVVDHHNQKTINKLTDVEGQVTHIKTNNFNHAKQMNFISISSNGIIGFWNIIDK